MPQYIKSIMLSEDYPDLPLVGQAIVHIPFLPEEAETDEGKAALTKEFKNLAAKASAAFHQELEAETYVKEGSLIIDVFFNCELAVLLSPQNLSAIGVYQEVAVTGVKQGTQLYVAYRTFKAIKRLEKSMRAVCGTLKNYAFIRFSAMGRMVSRSKSGADGQRDGIGEGRAGILGLLARLYEAVEVCRGNAPLERRLMSMKRVRNATKTLHLSIGASGDREFLYGLLAPLIGRIRPAQPTGREKKRDVEDFNALLHQIQENLDLLRGEDLV